MKWISILVAVAALSGGCERDSGANELTADNAPATVSVTNPERVAALVDGVPITVDDVASLLQQTDAGMAPREALDALVRQQLLAAEAERRGFGDSSEVAAERSRALATALLDKEVQEISVDTLDQQRLRQVYESRLEEFVHGPERRVIHAVALVGKKRFATDEAREVIGRVHAAVRDAVTEDEFRSSVAPLIAEHGKKRFRVETLPPFGSATRRFAMPFVQAAFDLPAPGHVSQPFETKFGWHVLLVLEELPAADVPFEEAREIIGAEVVPLERKQRVEHLVGELRDRAGVFVYEPGPAPGEGER